MPKKNRGERSIPGCGAGMEALGRVAWRRNRGGWAPTYC